VGRSWRLHGRLYRVRSGNGDGGFEEGVVRSDAVKKLATYPNTSKSLEPCSCWLHEMIQEQI
jgi:hypothetical protein